MDFFNYKKKRVYMRVSKDDNLTYLLNYTELLQIMKYFENISI